MSTVPLPSPRRRSQEDRYDLPYRLVDRSPDWARRGACVNRFDVDFFVGSHAARPPDEVRQLCGGCVVRGDCLEWALARPEMTNDTVYGGLTPVQRRQLQRIRSFVRCPGCGGADVTEVERGEVCLGCGVSWLT